MVHEPRPLASKAAGKVAHPQRSVSFADESGTNLGTKSTQTHSYQAVRQHDGRNPLFLEDRRSPTSRTLRSDRVVNGHPGRSLATKAATQIVPVPKSAASSRLYSSNAPRKSTDHLVPSRNTISHMGRSHADAPSIQTQRRERPEVVAGRNPLTPSTVLSAQIPTQFPRRPVPKSVTPRINISKSINIVPHWHEDDSTRKLNESSVSRMTVTSRSSRRHGRSSIPRSLSRSGEGGLPAVVGPNLALKVNGESIVDSDSGVPNRHAPHTGHGLMPVKAARKFQLGRKATADNDDESDSNEASESSEGIDEESSVESEIDELEPSEKSREPSPTIKHPTPSRASVPSEELMQALEALSLSSVRMQKSKRLPFLLRNLRRGFRHRCRLVGVPVGPATPPQDRVSVVYRQRFGEDGGIDALTVVETADEYEARMSAWFCPLCDLHGTFRTREMLAKHLEWDHSEVDVTWEHPEKVIVKIPEFVDEDDLANYPSPSTSPQPSRSSHASESEEAPRSLASSTPNVIEDELQALNIEARTELEAVPPPTVPSSLHPKLKFYPVSAVRPTPSSSARNRSRSFASTARSSRASSTRASLPSRYPTPPPPSDPLGPAAQYPYLTSSAVENGVYYSCRPGGERLFDLLNTLSLEPFGVLAWFIVDKEEELFELDDVRDEDKVMQALWSRWILLNLNKFVENYYQGTIAFIDEYWRMIHRAAGWAALRVWLLMFVVNRYLKGTQMASILRHYETLTGMDQWYE